MAVIREFICTCGVRKKVSNHWILARFTPQGIEFMPWDLSLALSSDIVVLCGEGCASAALSRCLGEWKEAHPTTVLAQATL